MAEMKPPVLDYEKPQPPDRDGILGIVIGYLIASVYVLAFIVILVVLLMLIINTTWK